MLNLRLGRQHILGWRVLPIGAGGYITGIQIMSDGRKYIRNDTYGAHTNTLAAPTWQQRLLSTTMPSGKYGYNGSGDHIGTEGVTELKAAPSDPSRVYMFYNGDLFVSNDYGSSWIETAFTPVPIAENPANAGSPKLYGPKIAVHPTNPDILYVSTGADGVQFSDDGGDTWSTVSGITASGQVGGYYIGYAIVFNKSNPNIVWIGSYGTGWYVSSASTTGASFSAISGTPTTFRTAKSDQDGNLYSCGPDGLERWNGSSWTTLAFNNSGGNEDRAQCVAIDPADSDHIVVIIDSGHMSVSTDGGSTWSGLNFGSHSWAATDIPWLVNGAIGANQYMSAGECDICPVTGKLYLSAGVGVWWTEDHDTGGTVVWTSESLGIEQLVSNTVLATSNGNLLYGGWDRGVFKLDGSTYPSDYGPEVGAHVQNISMCWWLEAAPEDPDFIVALNNYFGHDISSYSEDGGATWTKFTTNRGDGLINGVIAVASKDNWVWVPLAGSGHPYYTTDRGVTWDLWTVPSGVPSSPNDIGIGFSYTLNGQYLTADTVNGDFYLYLNGTDGDSSYAGVYKSTDGGDNWTKVNAGRLTGGGAGFKLRAVPGQAGHILRSAGRIDSAVTGEFQLSTDGGANWDEVPGITEVQCFGFGPTVASYPRVWAFGWVSGVPGFYYSDDANGVVPTWTMVGTDAFPLGIVDTVMCIEGDKITPGKCYVGFRGTGAVQYVP
jgi:hypothetical protein